MFFSVAYNGDIELIRRLADYDTVKNIYGTVSHDSLGDGRRIVDATLIDRKNIERAAGEGLKRGIEFNYLINGSCTGNREYSKAYRKEVEATFRWLMDIGVTWVTLANPIMIELCKSKFPALKVSLSSFAMADTVEKVRYFVRMGVDEITVSENITRNLQRLKRMSAVGACTIQVLVNQTCLYQCPIHFYHDNVMAHGTNKDERVLAEDDIPQDYCLMYCLREKLSDPEKLLKAPWIRPEDLPVYLEYGVCNFKITDRIKNTEWIIRAVDAYHHQRYDGNLADILNIIPFLDKRRGAVINKENIAKGMTSVMRRTIMALLACEINIDNARLENFILPFQSRDCSEIDCDACGYCKRISQEAISIQNAHEACARLREIITCASV